MNLTVSSLTFSSIFLTEMQLRQLIPPPSLPRQQHLRVNVARLLTFAFHFASNDVSSDTNVELPAATQTH